MMTKTEPPQIATPVEASERIEFVDILRGFAILGILVANMAAYSGQSRDLQVYSEAVDRAIVILIRFLVEAKFYSLFSFLFGWGMAVQMMRAQARGARFVPLYVRRLALLLLFGLLHAVFVWSGDVLTVYALGGLLLLLFRGRSEKSLLLASGLALVFSIVITVPGSTMDAFRTWYGDLTAFLHTGTHSQGLYATGTYREITQLRIQDFLAANSWFIYWFGNIFGMFLLGLYVGKRGIFHKVGDHLSLLRTVMWLGLVVGVASNAVYVLTYVRPDMVPPEYVQMVSRGSRTIGAPALMLFYGSAIILLGRKQAWARRLAPLAAVGRSALSNYLLQSVVCTLLCYGYGLALYGQVDPLLGLIFTTVIFLAQVRLSEWWFSLFRFGPAEWLWRMLTYGHSQPLRRKPAESHWGRTLWLRFRLVISRTNPKRALLAMWIVLLLWAGILLVWHLQLQAGIPPTSLPAAQIQPSATDAPEFAGTGSVQVRDAAGMYERSEAVATPVVQPAAYDPRPRAASGDIGFLASAFRAELALAQIEALTGPPHLGRYPSSPESRAAGDYIAQQFARYGLQPAGDAVSGGTTFFQSFPFEYVGLKTDGSLSIEGADGRVIQRYAPYQHYSAMVGWYAGSGTADGEVVWANQCSAHDLAALDVMDTVLLCQTGSIMDAERNALEYGASGLLLLTDPAERPPDFGSTFYEPWVPEAIPVLRVFPALVEDLLRGSGRSVEDLSFNFTPFSLATHVRMEVQTEGAEVCPIQGCQARNVLGVLPGRDPAYAHQVIVLGAHYDHLGQSPGGTVWPGANDDASGVAVLLGIARAWQEQGYVPRHTVLFAAWDAEEEGLLGSSYYVQHPRYPLQETMAMFQLDMVGAGGDTLWIDGSGDLGDRLRLVAEAQGVQVQNTEVGRSDHVPFLAAGVPANLLIWSFDQAEPEYHRPMDTVSIIQLDKLAAVGQILGIAVLGLTEGEPAIADLLERRATAVDQGDLEAFLATSLSDQEAADRVWFAEAQTLMADRVDMQAANVRMLGQTGSATVHITFESPAERSGGQTELRTFALDTRFEHDGEAWRWAGPDLLWAEGADGFAVAYPAQLAGAGVMEDLGRLAAEQYADMAARLGMRAASDASLFLFPDSQSLRASTAPTLPPERASWVAASTIKLTYSPEISTSAHLSGSLAQLLLAEAGVSERAAPWLWQGLPAVLAAQYDPVAAQAELYPFLQRALSPESVVPDKATSWAAVEYLRQQVGWEGLGRFITILGQECRTGRCVGAEGATRALSQTLGRDVDDFDGVWQTYWRDHLRDLQAGLDRTLTERAAAVMAGDQDGFLQTVDPGVPKLMAEEEHWFADLLRTPPESFALVGRPLAMLQDGRLLAQVDMRYHLASESGSRGEKEVRLTVSFKPENGRYLWAGEHLETLQGGLVDVLYPRERQALAVAVQREAEAMLSELTAALDVELAEAVTIKLYEDDSAWQSSISLALPPNIRLLGWTGEAESIKLRVSPEATADDLRPALAVQLGRCLMHEIGVDLEWLLKGVSLYLSAPHDGGAAQRAATRLLHKVQQATATGRLYDLRAMPPDYQLSDDELAMAQGQAWDTVRYLVLTYGPGALADLLEGQARGLDLSDALQEAIGQTLPEFQAAWAESLARAHTLPSWIEIASGFEPELAMGHVKHLASPDRAGRLAGSPGAEVAADYIAAEFARAGLVPVGDPSPGEPGDSSFFQTVLFTRTVLLSEPRLEILDENGQTLDALVYRRDFVIPVVEAVSAGTATGELIWMPASDQRGVQVGGRILVTPRSGPFDAQVARAVDQGAGGLVLLGEKESPTDLLAKMPFPAASASAFAFPVLELTQAGSERLLELAGHPAEGGLSSDPALPLGLQVRMEIPLSGPEALETSNVLGLLPGSDPEWQRQVVILGAHYDHVGDDPDRLTCSAQTGGGVGGVADTTCTWTAGRHYAGANDNASGVAVLLEIARLWHEAEYQPKHSVLFAAWGAQELGELGSEYYVRHPVVRLEDSLAMLQLDAVGGGDGYYLEAQGVWEREGLLLFNLLATEDWVDGRLALSNQSARSDQVPFREAGIPALLLTWRGASEDNWAAEIADEVQPYRLGVAGRMVTLAVMALTR